MERIFLLEQNKRASPLQVGGKGAGLSHLIAAGCNVPKTACITGDVYDRFLDCDGLREKIFLVLNRKPQKEMRWEEIWDTALRIKSLFLSTPMPQEMQHEISSTLTHVFGDTLVAVRSSATDEDQVAGSFAGLHESYLGIPASQILAHVKKVWASLWSDRALLYRQELGLAVETSRMAVVVQEMLQSAVSGVCFTHDPMGSDAMVVEAVYGLNQGLVDGQIEPDRWYLDKESGAINQWIQPGKRTRQTTAQAGITVVTEVAEAQRDTAPVDEKQLLQLKEVCLDLARQLNQPLDIEWTISDGCLYLLQARPISTLGPENQGDKRAWYLSLHRSYDNLQDLRKSIENDVLPAMEQEAAALSQIDLEQEDDSTLAQAIVHRMERTRYWTDIYWEKCIPFAHGVRLFGEIYNELVTPDDPYEFVELLSNQQMLSTHRNTQLLELASLIKSNQALRQELERYDGTLPADLAFRRAFKELLGQFGFLFPGIEEDLEYRQRIAVKIMLEYTRMHSAPKPLKSRSRENLKLRFLQRMNQAQYPFQGEELLDLARASYRIRDDDNVYLGKVELQFHAAVNAGRKRLAQKDIQGTQQAPPEELAAVLSGQKQGLTATTTSRPQKTGKTKNRLNARQITGQPAAKGIAQGRARVVQQPEDIIDFQAGEILVVESVDPNMTFIVPLAKAIIEKRGGMLIHGAIIAREYGIPCITGIPDATKLITTGDALLVDGYLGILTIEKKHYR